MAMKRIFLILALLVALMVVSTVAMPAQAGTELSQAPRIHVKFIYASTETV